MGKNQNSVLGIQLKIWWMIALDVKYHHTNVEQETPRWWLGTAVASGGPRFPNLSKMAKKKCHFGGGFRAWDVHGGGYLHWNEPG